jgi:hypothetical protein
MKLLQDLMLGLKEYFVLYIIKGWADDQLKSDTVERVLLETADLRVS